MRRFWTIWKTRSVPPGKTLAVCQVLNSSSVDTLLGALAKRKDEVNKLTGVSNNAGAGDCGLGKLLNTEQLDKIVASYPGGYVQSSLWGYEALELT